MGELVSGMCLTLLSITVSSTRRILVFGEEPVVSLEPTGKGISFFVPSCGLLLHSWFAVIDNKALN